MPAADQANASQADPPGLTVSVSVSASQHLIIEVLRRPIEFTQYTSYAFGKRCREAGVMPSMGSTGDAYDNAMAESFFATLEREVLNRRRFRSQADARMAIFQWLEGWYNPHRRHSALGYVSPINYERRQLQQTA